MTARRSLSEEELHQFLKRSGFQKHATQTETGTIWVHGETGKAIQVPNPIQGRYPGWLLDELKYVDISAVH